MRKFDNNITELVFILDRSGSMHGLEADTIGGFNSMIAKQKRIPGECYVSTVLFDNDMEVIHDRVRLRDVRPMTVADYTVRGCTALYDAVGGAIRHIANIHRYGRREDVPAKTLFVIITDGMENASRIYSAARVRAMIEKEKNKYGWEFIFLGANIDAFAAAGSFGITADRTANYRSDSTGTRLNYEVMSDAIMNMRKNRKIDACWSSRIDEDMRNRKF